MFVKYALISYLTFGSVDTSTQEVKVEYENLTRSECVNAILTIVALYPDSPYTYECAVTDTE